VRPNNFDLIRLLAATQVVIVHGLHHITPDNSSASLVIRWLDYFPGVPIFFVISGFLVSASYERSKTQKDYWVNRALRIFPALWVCFAVSVVSVLIFAPRLILDADPIKVAAWFVAQLTFFQFYNPDFLRPYGVGALNGSLWTIPVELQFYVGLPIIYGLLGIAKSKFSNLRLVIAFAVFVLVAQIFFRLPAAMHEETWFKLIQCSMFPHFWLFILGVWLQRNFESMRWMFEGKVFYWLGLHLLFIVVAQMSGIHSGYNKTFPLFALTVAGAAMAGAFSFRSVSDRTLAGNDISYGVYIYHMIVINALLSCDLVGRYEYLVIAIVASYVLAYLSWIIVEKPCLMLKKRWHQKKSLQQKSNPAT
jgi:peptidoglycan/LPS O-acetylase OafA/YrhL